MASSRRTATAPRLTDPSQHRRSAGVTKLVQFSSGLSRPFIERPVMTMLLTASVVVFGILAFKQLAVNDLPAVDYPVIQVSVNYPGANPETMANTIATPLEKQFTQIPGITLSTSSSTQGSTNITLQFDLSKSVDAAATDVQSAIQRAMGQLPNDLPQPPRFEKSNPNDQPVFFIALTSDTLTDGDLYKYATTQVQQQINILPGVSQVQIFGVKAAIRVKVDPGALAARNMTLDELSAAIRSGTSYAGAGQFDGKTRSFVLRPNAQIADAEGYRNLIIARGQDNTPIYLRDVATVVDSVQDERLSRHFFARGYEIPASTIVMAVSRQAGANAVEVATAIRELLPKLRQELPGSINLIPTFDRARTIENSVHEVEETLLIAFLLVVVVIFVFLGRATDTLIPVVALPLSLLITFVVMWTLGFSINNLTLLAITLAIGFLVDDAIVFLENVVRRAEHGESICESNAQQRGRDFLHHSLDDAVAGGRLYPAGFHARIARAHFPRVRHHHHRGDSRLGPGLIDPHPAHVRAHGARPPARASQIAHGTFHGGLFQADSSRLQPEPRLVPQPRLAGAADRDRLRGWPLVFLQRAAFHAAAHRR